MLRRPYRQGGWRDDGVVPELGETAEVPEPVRLASFGDSLLAGAHATSFSAIGRARAAIFRCSGSFVGRTDLCRGRSFCGPTRGERG